MIRKVDWKDWVIMGAAVALFVAADGLLMASNMGFKINAPLQNGFLLGNAPKGDCWRALPWMGPIKTYNDLCATLVNQGATKANIVLATLDCMHGTYTTVNCLFGNSSTIPVGAGIRIRVTGSTLASPNHVVLNGSHNETAAYPTAYGSFILGAAPKGDCWIAPPYHTTWLRASDVCAGFGLGVGQGNVTRLDCTTGASTTFSCGLVANNFTLVLGEAVRVRKSPLGDVAGVVPPHF